MGSDNHKKLERYILDHLKRRSGRRRRLHRRHRGRKFPVRNIIAKFPGTKDGIIVILAITTPSSLRNAGSWAQYGGSSTAILLEFANQLRAGIGRRNWQKRDGYSVWLVWTDGEEA